MSCKNFIDIYDTLNCEQKEILHNLYMTGVNHDGHSWVTYGDVEEAVAKLIVAERKTGKWFDNANVYDKRANKHNYFCLECKTNAMDFICGSEDWWCGKPPKYCPNCGAKMEMEGE